jgi:hypothetical protein
MGDFAKLFDAVVAFEAEPTPDNKEAFLIIKKLCGISYPKEEVDRIIQHAIQFSLCARRKGEKK